jgi:hypothetical protein
MAIGHTRRLHARFTSGAPGTDLLKEFVDEAKDLSKKVDRTITEWKDGDNDWVQLGKKTSANLELLREALMDKINDVNETWADMAANDVGNNVTQKTLSRAVQGACRSTTSTLRQIEEFQQDWRMNMDQEKQKSKNSQHIPTKQSIEHSTQNPTTSHKKDSYQAKNTNNLPISKPSRVTPPKNHNLNNSHLLAMKDVRKKLTMPTTVLSIPRPSSGKTQLRFNAKFYTSQAKALLSEDVHDRFG